MIVWGERTLRPSTNRIRGGVTQEGSERTACGSGRLENPRGRQEERGGSGAHGAAQHGDRVASQRVPNTRPGDSLGGVGEKEVKAGKLSQTPTHCLAPQQRWELGTH